MDSVVKFSPVASCHAAYARLGSARRTIEGWHTAVNQLNSWLNSSHGFDTKL
jgi:hypothetical protein